MNTAKTAKTGAATPYCSVCHNAGKTQKEYTSHWLRESTDKNAKVTCPYLRTLVCGYCKQQGHTPKYCPVAYENNKKKVASNSNACAPASACASASARAPIQAKVQAKVHAKQSSKNNFNVLQRLIDDEEETALKIIEHNKAFPTIKYYSSLPAKKEVLTGWAAIASKPKPKSTPRDWSEDWARQPERQNAVVPDVDDVDDVDDDKNDDEYAGEPDYCSLEDKPEGQSVYVLETDPALEEHRWTRGTTMWYDM